MYDESSEARRKSTRLDTWSGSARRRDGTISPTPPQVSSVAATIIDVRMETRSSRGRHRCDSGYAQLELVRASAGVGILPRYLAVQHELITVLPELLHQALTYWMSERLRLYSAEGIKRARCPLPQVVTEEQDSKRVSLLLGVLFGVVGMGSSSAAIALPMIATEFDVSVGVAAWTISGYVLFLAVTTAVYGRVSDLVGVRWPMVFGVTLMTVGALAAALAPTFSVLLIARLIQGAGAAAVPTLGVAVLSARYDGAVRGLALGRLAAIAASLGSLGPLLGGAVEHALGWRAVMALPVFAVLVIPLVWHALVGEGTGARLDVVGAVLVAITSGGMVLLIQSPSTGLAIATIGAVLVLMGAPLVAQRVRRRPHGFLPRAVLRNGRVVRSALAAASVPASWFALLIAVPAVLVNAGWEPWEVGLLLMPSAGIALFVPRWAGPLLDRRGSAWTLALAGVVATGSLLAGAAGTATEWPALLALAVVMTTVAFGFGQPALMAAVGDAVHADVRGVALGIATLLFLVGGSVGSAFIAGLGEVIGIPGSLAVLAVMPMLGLFAITPDLRRELLAPVPHPESLTTE